jgi:predicted amidohydrolase
MDTMRVFALELDNDIRGLEERKAYIEGLIERLPSPELVVLPELALCGFIPNQHIWQYADDKGKATTEWALRMAIKYNTYIGVGYADLEYNDFYNRYMVAGPKGVCGVVTQSEGVSAVFKRGDFKNTIETPFGKIAVAIAYDFHCEHFYANIKDEAISMILVPSASPDDPNKPEQEHKMNDLRSSLYISAFDVPVVYANCTGAMDEMPGKVGARMQKHGYRMNGMSRIYASDNVPIETDVPEAIGAEVPVHSKRRIKDLPFYNGYLTPGHTLFRSITVKQDILWAIKYYGKNHLAAAERLTKE